MTDSRNTWELAEASLAGSLTPQEAEQLQNRRAAEPDFDQDFQECIALLRTFQASAKSAGYRQLLTTIHKNERVNPAQKMLARIIALPASTWRTAGIAASVALITSAITFWSLTPSIKKTDNHYNKISREVEHIKKGLKSNTDDIENIKKSTKPVTTPASAAKYTGTGFALTNDGYFVTAWHVVNQGNFDSVYILTNDGDYHKSFLVAHDDKADIAIMKVDKKNFRFSKAEIPYTIEKSKRQLGAQIFTIGYPGDEEVYSEGYISSRNGFEGDNLQYTLELPASHGQSGSPVVDSKGNIIGMLTAIGSPGEANTYAVSAKALVALVDNSSALGNVHLHKSAKMSHLGREQQIGKMEDYTFSVKVYKK